MITREAIREALFGDNPFNRMDQLIGIEMAMG